MGRSMLLLLLLLLAPAVMAQTYTAGDFSDFGMGVQQVHLAQGKDPTSMMVSRESQCRLP